MRGNNEMQQWEATMRGNLMRGNLKRQQEGHNERQP